MLDLWALGLVWQDFQSLLDLGGPAGAGVEWLHPEPGCFLADPFLLYHKGVLRLFCEEYVSSRQRGRIAGFERKSEAWLRTDTFEQPFHLSYPWVLAVGEDLYCVPEQSQSGRLDLYRNWRFERTLLDFPAVDATPFWRDGRWWMWLGADPSTAKHELHLYQASELAGPWRFHSRQERRNLARCAGSALAVGERLLRPAQNRERTYGGSLLLYEVLELSQERYLERELVRWEAAPHWPYPDGLHHVSSLDGVVAFDAKRFVKEL